MRGDWGGTFSELIRVPYADFNLKRLPAGVDPVHLASIGDNLALGWESVMPALGRVADPEVAIFGGTGSIGLYCVDVAVHCGQARTVYYDSDPTRMAIAERLGATVRELDRARASGRFHLAVDASADPERLRSALLSVIPEGQVNSVGIYFEDVSLPLLELYRRGVNFHNGKGRARPNTDPTLDAVAAGQVHPELVTSGVHPWDDLPDVLTGLTREPGHKSIFVLS